MKVGAVQGGRLQRATGRRLAGGSAHATAEDSRRHRPILTTPSLPSENKTQVIVVQHERRNSTTSGDHKKLRAGATHKIREPGHKIHRTQDTGYTGCEIYVHRESTGPQHQHRHTPQGGNNPAATPILRRPETWGSAFVHCLYRLQNQAQPDFNF